MLRVLIIKPSSLGDIIHALQVAQSLRAQTDDVEIDWVAAKAFAPLVRACPVVDHVYEFDRHGSVAAFAKLCSEIRQKKYDWALDMQGLARSALLLAAARATQKARRADCREGAGLLCPNKPDLPPKGGKAHALDILLQFLPLLGCRAELAPEPLEFLHADNSPWPADLAARAPVVMFPDSRVKKKEWDGFYELTTRLLKDRPDLTIVWAGSSGPEPELDWPEARFVSLLGRTKIEALPELIGIARLVICNDSGPLHLAAAMHQHVIGLFGPTDHERFGPYPLDSPRHTILRAPNGKLNLLSPEIVMMSVEAAEVTSMHGPVEKKDGKFVLLIPLKQGGSKFLKSSKGISQIEGDNLRIDMQDWLAQKLGIREGSILSVNNRDGKFNIIVIKP